MRRSLIIALLALLGCVHAAEPTVPSRDSVRDLEQKAVALVDWSPRSGDVMPYCTGTWVSASNILTANHCVEDRDDNAEIDFVVRTDIRGDQALTMRPAILVARDEDHDLALLRSLDPPSHATAVIALTEPQAGDQVQAMGNPIGLWWTYSTGVVSAIRKKEINGMDAWWVQTTTPVGPGSSGGGLFDATGAIVGVCHGGWPRAQNTNVFVHRDYIATFLWRYAR